MGPENVGNAAIHRRNVGRIAERIVANELEYRGFRLSDLNKEGISAKADLLAAKDGRIWQIQVKGATEGGEGWWFGYGHCNEEVIARQEPMFNKRHNGFYMAEVVVLVCVKSLKEYSCLVLPVDIAEEAAQLNLDRYFRTPKKNGEPHKPGKVWVVIDHIPKGTGAEAQELYEREFKLLRPYRDNWDAAFESVMPPPRTRRASA
jgi:hypothetical protein